MSAGERPRPILVVDDDAGMRRLIRMTLEDEGLPVATAANGQEALELARQFQPALLVLDMTLPVLDGVAVAIGLRETYGESVPILTITADGAAREKASRAGAYAYLRKPFDLHELVTAVWRGLRRG